MCAVYVRKCCGQSRVVQEEILEKSVEGKGQKDGVTSCDLTCR